MYDKQHRGLPYRNVRLLRSRPSWGPDPHVTAIRIFVVNRHMHTVRDDPEQRTSRAFHLEEVVIGTRVVLLCIKVVREVDAEWVTIHRIHLVPPLCGSDCVLEDGTTVAPSFTELPHGVCALGRGIDRGMKANAVS